MVENNVKLMNSAGKANRRFSVKIVLNPRIKYKIIVAYVDQSKGFIVLIRVVNVYYFIENTLEQTIRREYYSSSMARATIFPPKVDSSACYASTKYAFPSLSSPSFSIEGKSLDSIF